MYEMMYSSSLAMTTQTTETERDIEYTCSSSSMLDDDVRKVFQEKDLPFEPTLLVLRVSFDCSAPVVAFVRGRREHGIDEDCTGHRQDLWCTLHRPCAEAFSSPADRFHWGSTTPAVTP